MAFIASPEIVMAFALAGTLSFNPMTDTLEGADGTPFRLEPPSPAPEVPVDGFVSSGAGYFAPAEDPSIVELVVNPRSQRLQVLEPFPAWDGEDILEMQVLLKVRGKCTTDHISPAGPWLSLRGHLDRISDNAFLGAENAFTGEAGKGLNQVTAEAGRGYAATARDYKARGLRWVAIGDQNYGEGSSREHAAMTPRHLGCAVVIVRSFARIHETNLKKQGILALTFADPADYDRVQETDRVSVMGLRELAPGQPLTGYLHHADGGRDQVQLLHTMNAEHIGWFQAGAALNVLRLRASA
jgi:aconitate hydratase